MASKPLELESLRAEELGAIGEHAPQGAGLGEICAHVVSSKGKQLRARVVLAAAENGRHPKQAAVRTAAAAVEAIHLASLTHDDVIDEGRERRGVPTAVAMFGDCRAAIAGNWLVGRSVELIAQSGDEAVSAFAKAATALIEGEMREVASLHDTGCTAESYLMTVRQKTGGLFWLAARLGGVLAAAEPDVIDGLERYGWELGTTYQMADDLLDLLTMEEVCDKTGRDLCNGLYTLPVIYAMEESEQLRLLLEGCTTYDDELIARVIAMVRATGGVERALEDFHSRARSARAAIQDLPSTEGLETILDYVVNCCAVPA